MISKSGRGQRTMNKTMTMMMVCCLIGSAVVVKAVTMNDANDDDLYRLIGTDTKCSKPKNDDRRLFRISDPVSSTAEECYELCNNWEGCEYFSWGGDDPNAVGKSEWVGLCIGCSNSASEDRQLPQAGFTNYKIMPTTNPPTNEPTLDPTTESPTDHPTLRPTTESPTASPTQAPVAKVTTQMLAEIDDDCSSLDSLDRGACKRSKCKNHRTEEKCNRGLHCNWNGESEFCEIIPHSCQESPGDKEQCFNDLCGALGQSGQQRCHKRKICLWDKTDDVCRFNPKAPPDTEISIMLAETNDDLDLLLPDNPDPRPPPCQDDVRLVKTNGATPFPDDPTDVVEIASQNTTTVTVNLRQVGFLTRYPIDQIYYHYRETVFDQKCYEETNVEEGAMIADEITMYCNAMTPVAHLELCLVDDLEHGFLKSQDNAQVPKCCHADNQEETVVVDDDKSPSPTVCYTLQISCDSQCDVESSRPSRLRGRRR